MSKAAVDKKSRGAALFGDGVVSPAKGAASGGSGAPSAAPSAPGSALQSRDVSPNRADPPADAFAARAAQIAAAKKAKEEAAKEKPAKAPDAPAVAVEKRAVLNRGRDFDPAGLKFTIAGAYVLGESPNEPGKYFILHAVTPGERTVKDSGLVLVGVLALHIESPQLGTDLCQWAPNNMGAIRSPLVTIGVPYQAVGSEHRGCCVAKNAVNGGRADIKDTFAKPALFWHHGPTLPELREKIASAGLLPPPPAVFHELAWMLAEYRAITDDEIRGPLYLEPLDQGGLPAFSQTSWAWCPSPVRFDATVKFAGVLPSKTKSETRNKDRIGALLLLSVPTIFEGEHLIQARARFAAKMASFEDGAATAARLTSPVIHLWITCFQESLSKSTAQQEADALPKQLAGLHLNDHFNITLPRFAATVALDRDAATGAKQYVLNVEHAHAWGAAVTENVPDRGAFVPHQQQQQQRRQFSAPVIGGVL